MISIFRACVNIRRQTTETAWHTAGMAVTRSYTAETEGRRKTQPPPRQQQQHSGAAERRASLLMGKEPKHDSCDKRSPWKRGARFHESGSHLYRGRRHKANTVKWRQELSGRQRPETFHGEGYGKVMANKVKVNWLRKQGKVRWVNR